MERECSQGTRCVHAGTTDWSTSGRRLVVGEVAEAPDRQELLTALTTEHFTLQSARSQTASESAPAPGLHPPGHQRPGRAGVDRPGVAGRHHLRCLRPHRSPDALCPRRLHLRASGRVRCRGLPLRRRNQPDTQLLQADHRRPGEALPALRARRRTRGVRERCGAAREAQAVLHLRNGRRRDQQRGRWQLDATALGAIADTRLA